MSGHDSYVVKTTTHCCVERNDKLASFNAEKITLWKPVIYVLKNKDEEKRVKHHFKGHV